MVRLWAVNKSLTARSPYCRGERQLKVTGSVSAYGGHMNTYFTQKR